MMMKTCVVGLVLLVGNKITAATPNHYTHSFSTAVPRGGSLDDRDGLDYALGNRQRELRREINEKQRERHREKRLEQLEANNNNNGGGTVSGSLALSIPSMVVKSMSQKKTTEQDLKQEKAELRKRKLELARMQSEKLARQQVVQNARVAEKAAKSERKRVAASTKTTTTNKKATKVPVDLDDLKLDDKLGQVVNVAKQVVGIVLSDEAVRVGNVRLDVVAQMGVYLIAVMFIVLSFVMY